MDIILKYNRTVKQNDIGDIFEIKWLDNGPEEFTFAADTTCYFIFKHMTLLNTTYRRKGVVDVNNKIGSYRLQVNDAFYTGPYTFEFEFTNGTSQGNYRQTYPKADTLTYEVVSEIN